MQGVLWECSAPSAVVCPAIVNLIIVTVHACITWLQDVTANVAPHFRHYLEYDSLA
jgi:hypothetical protein